MVLALQRDWLVRHSLAVNTRPTVWGLEFWKPWLEVLSLKATIEFSGNKVTSLLDTSESPSFVDCRMVILILAFGEYRQCHGSCNCKRMVLGEVALLSEFECFKMRPLLGDKIIPGEI